MGIAVLKRGVGEGMLGSRLLEASALPHNSSRSSSLQMQALLWLFMKGRQPRVQTALNTVSAMDSQAAGREKIRQVSSRHCRVPEGWVEAPWPDSCPRVCGACSRPWGLLPSPWLLSPSPWLLHFYKSDKSPLLNLGPFAAQAGTRLALTSLPANPSPFFPLSGFSG